jgi:hypothetical protein
LDKLSPNETENPRDVVTGSPSQPAADRVHGFRRSRRVRFEMPVNIYLCPENAKPTSEAGATLTVNAHGALLAMRTPLALGDKLRLINPRTRVEIDCHVRRIVMRYPNGVSHVGVEFVEATPAFWDIESPPQDWDPNWVPPAERKRPEPPEWSAPASGGRIPKPRADSTDEQDDTAASDAPKRWRLLSLPTFAVAGLLTLGLIWMVISRSGSAATAARWIPASQSVAPEDASLISDSENYRVATSEDFARESVSWLSIAGQQASGDIPGAYSASGSSHAYVLIGRDSSWRVLIVANGQVRCEARYRTLAIVAHIAKNLIQRIDWSDRPALEPEGDGLLVVRAANDPASGVVLFLQGDQVLTGTPANFDQVLQRQAPQNIPPVFFPRSTQ